MTNKFEAIEKASKGEITIEMRPVYIINGAVRARLTERAALNKLASLITQREFHKDGRPTNEPDMLVKNENGDEIVRRGEPTASFMGFKEGVLISLLDSLRKEKEIAKLEKQYQAANAKSDSLLKELISAKNK
ncbi:hypothetical protein CKG00_08150 [Morganella morganii]|uniref:Uncharacterized protein n=1 Tax=Morganella morganii TaxID=582 RepID=A0A433ZW49_MORMO|nr:hypothetical protein [Morganella morganii]RUT66368.1 hypothetical protein CKG00_08150 [Morganella morganii]